MSGTNGSYITNDAVVNAVDGVKATADAILAKLNATPAAIDYTQLLYDIRTATQGIDADTANLALIDANTDHLEALVTTGNATQAQILAATNGMLTQLQAINANTDAVEALLGQVVTALTVTTKVIKTGGANIAAGSFAGASLYGTSATPPAVTGVLQSYTVTVLKSSGAPLAGNAVRVVTDAGTFHLVEGMSQTFSVAQDNFKIGETLSTALAVTAVGNSAAVVTWTWE